jgi:hypothetical protein
MNPGKILDTVLNIGWFLFLLIFTPIVAAFYIVVTPWYGAKETYYDFIGWVIMAWSDLFDNA